ncbi:MAG: hypothetical protein LBV27_08980 [Oscillospiraceae bacterium]|jgi:hypothetical protein|nr:hypothetical protein [Oscillospiraceae bacterium]
MKNFSAHIDTIADRLKIKDDVCPAIAYQMAKHCGADVSRIEELRDALEKSPDVQKLLQTGAQVMQRLNFNTVHGSTNIHLENVLPMLLDRGLDVSFNSFGHTFSALCQSFDQPLFADTHCFRMLIPIILAPLLLWAGYRNERLLDFYKKRLVLVSDFCARMDYDIYGPQGDYGGIPKPFQDRKVINPALYPNGAFHFPLLHDLYAYRAMYPEAAPEERARIDAVLKYVLSPDYQDFPKGYGLLREGSGHYYAMGWDCKLPRNKGVITAPILHRMELLAAFPPAVRSEWFQAHLDMLMQCAGEDGMFDLPKKALGEKESYWISGGHMGLGENRWAKDALRALGSFRVFRIFSNIAHCGGMR